MSRGLNREQELDCNRRTRPQISEQVFESGLSKMDYHEQDTTPDLRGNFKHSFFASQSHDYHVELVAASHVGKTRLRNEDHFAVFRRTRNCEMLMSNLPSDDVAFVIKSKRM